MNKAFLIAVAVSGSLHVLLLAAMANLSGGGLGHGRPATPAALTANIVMLPPRVQIHTAPTQEVDRLTTSREEARPHFEPPAETDGGGGVQVVPDYYPASSLSQMPRTVTELADYLPLMADPNVRGKLTIRLWIDRAGVLDRLSVIEGNLPSVVEQLISSAFRKMRFTPGQIGDTAVKTWVDVSVEYGTMDARPKPEF